jgi:hypothetical protein
MCQRYVLLIPVLSARARPRARRSTLRQCGQARASVSVGPGLACATSSTRSLLFSLIDPSVWVAPGGQGGRGARRGVVTMTVGMGFEQGGPGPMIPTREAGDLVEQCRLRLRDLSVSEQLPKCLRHSVRRHRLDQMHIESRGPAPLALFGLASTR